MSYPQPKLPSSNELIERHSVAGTWAVDREGQRRDTANRGEGLRQVKAYR
jgi:hypothetical protein